MHVVIVAVECCLTQQTYNFRVKEGWLRSLVIVSVGQWRLLVASLAVSLGKASIVCGSFDVY